MDGKKQVSMKRISGEKEGEGKSIFLKCWVHSANDVFDSNALIAISVNLNPCNFTSCLGNSWVVEALRFSG